MLIVGNDLKKLIENDNIISNSDSYDVTCLELALGEKVIELKPTQTINTLNYGEDIPKEIINETLIQDDGIVLPPKSSVIASSNEKVNMPLGYFGLLQTKASLARMCVSLHFSDGQIDPGFKGKVTFEIFNASDFAIRLYKNLSVGNLYILKASSTQIPEYNGKYCNNDGPTIFKS